MINDLDLYLKLNNLRGSYWLVCELTNLFNE